MPLDSIPDTTSRNTPGDLHAMGGMNAAAADVDYVALREGAVWFDRRDRVRWRFPGTQAVEVLNGLLTNDVKTLETGAAMYAAALTPKGKIVADVRLFRFHDSVLTDTNPAAAKGWEGIIRKYVNPRLSAYRDASTELGDIGIFGPKAEVSVGHVTPQFPEMTAVRVSDLGDEIPGYELFFPSATVPYESVVAALRTAGAVDGTPETWQVARVEAGRPEWGIDMDDTMLSQEANLDALGAISYQKGCYTGQEVVARLHFRGHVNRYLRLLQLASGELPALHTPVINDSGSEVGDTRSVVQSPRHGPLAMALIRREVPAGTVVIVGGGAKATVMS